MDLVYINLLFFFYSHMIVENLIRRYEVLSVICKSHGTGEVRPIEHIEEKKNVLNLERKFFSILHSHIIDKT